MPRVKVDEDIRPMSEVRTGIASFLKRVHGTKRPLVITQHGKGVAVLLDVREYEAMQEKIELLQDIQTSISQLEGGAAAWRRRSIITISESCFTAITDYLPDREEAGFYPHDQAWQADSTRR